MSHTAIYEGAEDWKYVEETSLTGDIELKNGMMVNAEETKEELLVKQKFLHN